MSMSSQTTRPAPKKLMQKSALKIVLVTISRDAFFVFIGILAFGLLWQLSARHVAQSVNYGLGSLILPEPFEVLDRFRVLGFSANYESEVFWLALKGSLSRALSGFGLALIAATVLGVLSGLKRPIHSFLYPFVQLLRAVPVMSVILYLILFLPSDWVAIWVSFFIVFPILYTNVVSGFAGVDEKLLEMANLYQLNKIQKLIHIYRPAILPYWLAGALTGMGINIKAVITAEAMSLPENSFGLLMAQSRNYLDTTTLLAITVWIILLAITLDLTLLCLKWLILKGRRSYVLYRRRP